MTSPVLKIDLGKLAANFAFLTRSAGSAECAAVVKADAYGLGMQPIVEVLSDGGCRTFFVARETEALALRRIHSQCRIYALGGVSRDSATAVRENGIIPVLNSAQQAEAWLATSGRSRAPTAVHVDTGMNRLGFSEAEIETLVGNPRLLRRLNVDLILTHLIAADQHDTQSISRQLSRFDHWRSYFPNSRTSIGNSAGTLLGAHTTGLIARPGIAIYGGNPFVNEANPMRPVVSLEAPILQIRTVAAGESVGYGAQFVASSRLRIATVAAGYADGIPRCLSDMGTVLIGGEQAPIVGRVSMDSTTVDVTSIREESLAIGSTAIFIGGENSLERVAADAGTISYELLTGISGRCERRYEWH